MAWLGLLLVVALGNAVPLLDPAGGAVIQAAPHLTFLAAVFIGLQSKEVRPLYLAVALGVFQDCFSMAWPIGHFAFLYGATAYVAWRLRRYLPPESAVAQSLAAFLCGIVAAFLGLLLVLASRDVAAGPGFSTDLLRAVTSAVAAPPVFWLLDLSRLFQRAFGRRRYTFS